MNCRSCKSTKFTDVLNLGDQYLSDFNNKGDKKPEFHPLEVVMCNDCSLVQLKHTTPSNLLYNNHYGYYSGVSNTLKADLKDIVQNALAKGNLNPNDVVVDIGSNDGTLLKNYPNKLVRIGFDPVEKFGEFYKNEQNLLFANYFFDKDIYYQIVDRPAKVITAISMFYDLDDPNKFVRNLRDCLDEEGIIIIQQNYVGGMIKQNAFDNIVHEHLEYYSLASMEKLLSRHGLEVFDVDVNDINGGSFRTYIRHMNRVRLMRALEQKMRLTNKWTYMLFGMRVKQIAKKLHTFVKKEVDNGKKVYVYGASTRGNTLLQVCGLDNKLITAAVERNPVKFGKQIASLEIPIISEEQARKEKPDYFLVLPWFNAKEIIKREEEFVKSGGSLIFPLPDFYVVDNSNYSKYTK